MPQYIINFEEGNSPGPFNVYLSGSSGETLYAAGVTKAQLEAGFVVLFDDSTPSSSIVVVNESYGCGNEVNLPFPTVTPSFTPSSTITPSITPTRFATPSVTRTITPTVTLTPSRTVTHTVTVSVSPSYDPLISNSVTPTVTVTRTPSITPTRTTTPQPPNLFLEVSQSSGPANQNWEVIYTNNNIPVNRTISTTLNTVIPGGYSGINGEYSANPLGVNVLTPIQIQIRKTTGGGILLNPTGFALYIDSGGGWGFPIDGGEIAGGTNLSSFLNITSFFSTTEVNVGYKMKLLVLEG